MYFTNILRILLVISCLSIHEAYGQFSFGSGAAGFPAFKLPGSLGSLTNLMSSASSSSPMNLMSSNLGFGNILGQLISSATGSSSSGGPLSQLATAASNQYMNAIRQSPFGSLMGQFAGQSSTSSASPPNVPPMSPHSMHSPYGGSPHMSPYMNMNPMGLLGGDSSMYAPPPSGPGGYEPHFGSSNVFPQFAPPENYYPPQYGPGPGVVPPPPSAVHGGHHHPVHHHPQHPPMPQAALYSGPPMPSSSYGSHMPPTIHHIDRKK